jgi:hypothetical protein
MFSFDAGNKTLMFHPQFFADHPEAVVQVKWREGIRSGATIRVGSLLGIVIFNDGSRLFMKIPAGVSGTIAATNRAITYELLSVPPAQFALRLI